MTKIETKEELDFLKSIEKWNISFLKNDELKNMKTTLNSATKNTIKKLTKRKAFNIRLLEDDIIKLKAMSLNKWIPYQTYITNVVHEFTTWKLK